MSQLTVLDANEIWTYRRRLKVSWCIEFANVTLWYYGIFNVWSKMLSEELESFCFIYMSFNLLILM